MSTTLPVHGSSTHGATVYELARQAANGQVLIAGYIPRNSLTAIACSLYGVVCLLLWLQWWRNGKHKWMLTLTIGTTCMLIGFFVRIGCNANPYSLGLYIISTLFILLSPCAFLAADYVCLSRIAIYLGRDDVCKNCLMFPVTALVKFFVIADVSTFLIQAAGGGITASTRQNPKLGNSGQIVSTIGLVLQLVSFASYTCILLLFGYRVKSRYPDKWHASRFQPQLDKTRFVWYKALQNHPIADWRILYYTLCVTCIGFLTRSGFRVAEFQGGYNSYIYTHESYFYLLDALPLLLAIILFVFVWPPRFLKHPELFESKQVASSSEDMIPYGGPVSVQGREGSTADVVKTTEEPKPEL